MRSRILLGALSAAVVIIVASAIFLLAPPDVDEGVVRLKPGDLKLVRLGADIYAQNCAACHGDGLKGERDWMDANPDGSLKAPPHDETGHTWHHQDDLLFRITKLGTAKAVGLENFNSNMPAFEGVLTDTEIIAVLSWIKAQWPQEIRERHDLINAQGGAPSS